MHQNAIPSKIWMGLRVGVETGFGASSGPGPELAPQTHLKTLSSPRKVL